jgi:hypothetical protein
MLLNGASTHGPLAAFKFIPRKLHRFGDWALIVLMLVAAAAGGSAIDSAGRAVLLALSLIHAFVTLRTSFEAAPPREFRKLDRVEMSQLAGHVSGKVYKAARAKGRVVGQAAGETASKATATAAHSAGRGAAGAANLLSAMKERRRSEK